MSTEQGLEIQQTPEHNFTAFANDPNYRAENVALITRAFGYLPSNFRHIDVASGTGLVAQELSKLCVDAKKPGTTVGIEPDTYARNLAETTTLGNNFHEVLFVNGYAGQVTDIKFPGGADWVSIHDALHEIPGTDTKQEILNGFFRVLKPGGIFTLNSAFTTKAMASDGFKYGSWAVKAYKLAKKERQKTDVEILSPEDYAQMAQNAGFKIVYEELSPVIMTRMALEGISRYPAFVRGFFPNTSQQEIPFYSDKLIGALDSLGIQQLNRNFYRLLAKKLV